MIKKLRRRFIAVNMSILSFVLIGVLTGIFVYMYTSEVEISYELMESILHDNNENLRNHEREQPNDAAFALEIPDAALEVQNMSYLSLTNGSTDVTEPYDDYEEYYNELYPKADYWQDNDYRHEPDDPYNPDYQRPTPPFGEMYPTEPVPPEKPTYPPMTEPSENIGPTEPETEEPTHSPTQSPTQGATQDSTQKPTQSPVQGETQRPTQGETQPPIVDETQQPTDETGAVTESETDEATKAQEQDPLMPVPPEIPEEKPDPYKGNVKRPYIILDFNNQNDVEKLVYEYIDDMDEEAVRTAAVKIMKDDDNKGTVVVGQHNLRYMKQENIRKIGGMQLIMLDRTLEISTLNRMLFIFIIIASVGIIIIFCLSVLLANWTIKPVDTAWQKQKQFVADASHELKTPLTVIQANTDVILSNSSDTVQNQSKWLGYIKDETARMTKLVNSMLYIAKCDSNQMKMVASQFDLSDVVSSICLQYEAIVFEQGKTLETEIEEGILYKGDLDKIKQLINILLDNAQKYSTENGVIKVIVSSEQKNGKIRLVVANSSNFIAADKLDKLFDRFYRLDDSRNRKTGGSGLGLNIAKSIVDAHNGVIKATHENSMTTFNVIL